MFKCNYFHKCNSVFINFRQLMLLQLELVIIRFISTLQLHKKYVYIIQKLMKKVENYQVNYEQVKNCSYVTLVRPDTQNAIG